MHHERIRVPPQSVRMTGDFLPPLYIIKVTVIAKQYCVWNSS